MREWIREHQRALLAALIAVCMLSALLGGTQYFKKLKNNLLNSAVQDVMNVTLQQKQSFDSFISLDREQLHEWALYFSRHGHGEDLKDLLAVFAGADANFALACLDEDWICSSKYGMVDHSEPEEMAEYHELSGSGIRDNYVGISSGIAKFAFYEEFTFPNGHAGLVQKSYDRSTVLATFSLSLYNGEGYGYILDSSGDIVMRSVERQDSYDNIFSALEAFNISQSGVDTLMEALEHSQTGSVTLDGDNGRVVFTYTPVDSVEGWHLLSLVPEEVIRKESDMMLQDTQITFTFLLTVLVICTVFFLLIRRTQKDIDAKDEEVKYQARLFEVFVSYLSDYLDDVYILMDQKTEDLEYVSPNVERVLGVDGERMFDYIRAADIESDPEATADYYERVKAMQPGDMLEPRNTERVDPQTGETKYFVERAYCTDILGRIKRVCYISDRTKEQKAQDTLSEALRMAQAASDAKTAFLSNVSHDIRTPMNAIIGFLELMRNEADNPDTVREYTQRIDAASQHLLGLINDVLDMNKIESGGATLNITELNLAEVIEEINTIIRPQSKAKNQTFDIFVTHMNYEHLLGDKLRLNQILINLLSNAVKYTPDGGALQLRVEELPQVVNNYSRVRFTVSDNGLGMSADYLKVIFDPFTREDTKTTRQIQGTGLGMAITKSLVDLMGGTIRVESVPGEGSTFTVELELRIQEREDDPRFWEVHKVTRMIVVDDEEEVCHNIVKTMSRAGVECDFATDGESALRMMREEHDAGQPYDLVLLDWIMPDLNGLETARRIRNEYSDEIPILLLTAYDWSEIEQEAIEIGVNHFMPKPFFMSTFKDAIRRILDHRKREEGDQSDVVRDKRVLVVDDIEVNRIILVKILSSLGAICDTAGDGQEAVDKFQSSDPGDYDLILMDVQMPVMDGYSATRAIRAGDHPESKTVPIIAMTANAFVDDVRDAIESGMDAHIAKPVQIDNLKSTIQQVLDSRKEQSGEEQVSV